MFGTDLSKDYEAATALGLDPRTIYQAGLEGALCGASCRERLEAIGDDYDWEALP